MNRFIIDRRDTNIAVRDTQHPYYETNKVELNSLLEDVVCIFSATFGEWGRNIDEYHIEKITRLCEWLNVSM